MLSNGEFGRRLIDHAQRHRLPHVAVEVNLVSRWIWPRHRAARRTGARLWAVASETSTMLNDVGSQVTGRASSLACLDCVSAIGAVPLTLDGVYLASGASGKALASFPGLCFVFYAHDIPPQPERLPRYLDLGYYPPKNGIPFPHSSNLIGALDAALVRFESDEPFKQLAELSGIVRPGLRDLGWAPLVPDSLSTPAVVTVALTNGYRAAAIGERLGREGLMIARLGEYLAERNWFQVSLMGIR